MTSNAFFKTIKIETILYFRNFFGPFFSIVFPVMMVILFGSIYGNEPSEYMGWRGAMDASIPAYLAMVIGVNGIMTLPLNLSEYQANKVYKRFEASPFGKGNLVLGQLVVYCIATILSAIILVVSGLFIYNVNIEGSFLIIIPAFLLSLASMFAFGFFIAAIFKDSKMAQTVSYIVYFIMLFLSGASLPAEMFPEHVHRFIGLIPLTHVVRLMQATFWGEPLGEQLEAILVILAILIVCGGSGMFFWRRQK